MKRTGVCLAIVLAVAALAAARGAEVTYVTGRTVYIDAGQDDGLTPGDTIDIVRGDEVLLALEVVETTNHRATCRLPEGSSEVRIGDRARFEARASLAPASSEEADPPRSRHGAGFRGRIGLRYLGVRNRITGQHEYSQPGIDFRIDGNHIAGTPWSLNADVRASRINRTGGSREGTSDDRTRVYRMAVTYGGGRSPWRVTAGRQYTSDLANVSIFDGISFSYGKPRWATGAFTGTQPDPVDLSHDSTIREHGAWFQVRGASQAGSGWFFTTGLVGSYAGSEVNREYLYLQGRYTTKRIFLYGLQEVDYNRDWKRELEDDTVSPTNTFLSARWQATRALSFNAGYDNRRLVRLYRDRETPETEFDETFRQGVWAGASAVFLKNFRLGVDARTNSGGTSPYDSHAYSVLFGASGFTSANLYAQARATGFGTDRSDGTLYSLSGGASLGRRVDLGITGGVREDRSEVDPEFDASLAWVGLDVDVFLGRHWFLFVSVERTDGDYEEYDQIFTSVTYRF